MIRCRLPPYISGGKIERRGTPGFQLTGLPSCTADLFRRRSPLPAVAALFFLPPSIGSRSGIDRHVCPANVNSGTCAPVDAPSETRSFLPLPFFPMYFNFPISPLLPQDLFCETALRSRRCFFFFRFFFSVSRMIFPLQDKSPLQRPIEIAIRN